MRDARYIFLLAFHCTRVLSITHHALKDGSRTTAHVFFIGSEGQSVRKLKAKSQKLKSYFLYCVGNGPFSKVSRSQIQPSRV
jgi:hypothetical protein